MIPDIDEIPDEFESSLERFLDVAVETIIRHESAEHYLGQVDTLMAKSGFGEWFEADSPYWIIAHAVWDATPLPSCGFRPRTLPEPKRNDRCPCGSGKKFKRCCQSLLEHGEDMSMVGEMPIIQRAVTQMTQAQRKQALKEAPVRVRLAVAVHEMDSDHPGKARDIALSLLESGKLERDLQAHAVLVLGDAYEALGHQAAGEKTFQSLLPGLKPEACGAALLWLAGRALENDQPEAAMELLVDADLIAPGNLITGLLQVTCLRALGEDEEAQEAAKEWLPLAKELGDPAAIELLEEQASLATLADAGEDSLLHSFGEIIDDDDDLGPSQSDLDAITRLLEKAGGQPLLPIAFAEGPPDPDSAGDNKLLELSPEIKAAEAVLYRDIEAPDPIDPALITQHPELLQSPTFLESLDEAGQELFFHDRAAFARALQDQQRRLIEHILEALPEGGLLPWSWTEHRPVISLLAQQAFDTEDSDRAIAIFQRVLALCPNDNLGIRAPLTDALLKAGRNEEALALCEAYLGDHLAEIQYGRVLALVRLKRLHDAEAALADAYQALPKVLNYLTAKKRKRPKLNPYGVTLGGTDQAWLYREQMRATFEETPGMLNWMEKTKRRLPQP